MSSRAARIRYEAEPLKEWPSGKTPEQVTRELQTEGYSSCPEVVKGAGAAGAASAAPPPPPLLVIYGHSSARKEWTRQQRRIFNRLTSWCFEAVGRDAQLLRVDLTTAVGGRVDLLGRHLQELRRRVERKFGFKGVEVFKVETTEGNGVLHMVWAWIGSRSFYVPQVWLSETWDAIHGAPIVYVRKMELCRTSIKRVGRYFALQYLADQRGALVRMSWSWWRSRVAIARGWEKLKKEFRKRNNVATWTGCNPDMETVTFTEVLNTWESLLREGAAMLGGTLFEVRDREIMEVF